MIKILICIGIFIVGIIFGFLLVIVTEDAGSLIVDESDEIDGPYLFLELRVKPDVIKNKKTVLLYVQRRGNRE